MQYIPILICFNISTEEVISNIINTKQFCLVNLLLRLTKKNTDKIPTALLGTLFTMTDWSSHRTSISELLTFYHKQLAINLTVAAVWVTISILVLSPGVYIDFLWPAIASKGVHLLLLLMLIDMNQYQLSGFTGMLPWENIIPLIWCIQLFFV